MGRSVRGALREPSGRVGDASAHREGWVPNPDVGLRLNNLAALCHTQGRYAEAELLDKRCKP